MKKKAASARTKKKTASKKEAPISKPALKLIDQAADLLKKAVVKGEKETVAGRRALKRNALSFVDYASERLSTAVEEGSKAARKGVRKL